MWWYTKYIFLHGRKQFWSSLVAQGLKDRALSLLQLRLLLLWRGLDPWPETPPCPECSQKEKKEKESKKGRKEGKTEGRRKERERKKETLNVYCIPSISEFDVPNSDVQSTLERKRTQRLDNLSSTWNLGQVTPDSMLLTMPSLGFLVVELF